MTRYRFVCQRKKCRYEGGDFTAREVRELKQYHKEHGVLPFPCAKCGTVKLKMVTVKIPAKKGRK